jgi:hypothetical protein
VGWGVEKIDCCVIEPKSGIVYNPVEEVLRSGVIVVGKLWDPKFNNGIEVTCSRLFWNTEGEAGEWQGEGM